VLLKMALAATRETAPPMFWQKMRMDMAVGICGAGMRFWIAM